MTTKNNGGNSLSRPMNNNRRSPPMKILWIGGTSCLTRTYINEYGYEGLMLVGQESERPSWMATAENGSHCNNYISCDLTKLKSPIDANNDILSSLPPVEMEIQCIIVGIRPKLVHPNVYCEETKNVIVGLELLLEQACHRYAKTLKYILHISSVAAVNHLQAQHLVKEEDDDGSTTLPSSAFLVAPYDVFKRNCEIVVERICNNHNNKKKEKESVDIDGNGIGTDTHQQQEELKYTNLRISAIFSDDDEKCIQCNALKVQCRVGCYVPHPIDCNSSLNVSRAIHTMIQRALNVPRATTSTKTRTSAQIGQQEKPLHSLYYYTRPLSLLKVPIPYGEYLVYYRRAYGITSRTSIWVPMFIMTWFVTIVHWIAHTIKRRCRIWIPYLDSIDYLLQVSIREHSFDNTRFFTDFGSSFKEESILECFQRIRRKQQRQVEDDAYGRSITNKKIE